MKKANLILSEDYQGNPNLFTDITYYFDNNMNELGCTSIVDELNGFCLVSYGRIWDKELLANNYVIKDV